MNFSPQRSIMMVMTQVEAHLKSGAPLEAVQRLLSEFVRAVTQE